MATARQVLRAPKYTFIEGEALVTSAPDQPGAVAAAGWTLCLEVFALTGPLPGGPGEFVVLAMLGAWVAVGTSHAMAAVMHRAGLAGGSDEA